MRIIWYYLFTSVSKKPGFQTHLAVTSCGVGFIFAQRVALTFFANIGQNSRVIEQFTDLLIFDNHELHKLAQKIVDCDVDYLSNRVREVETLDSVSDEVKKLLLEAISDRASRNHTEDIQKKDPNYLLNRLREVLGSIQKKVITEKVAADLVQKIHQRQYTVLEEKIKNTDSRFIANRYREINDAVNDKLLSVEQASRLTQLAESRDTTQDVFQSEKLPVATPPKLADVVQSVFVGNEEPANGLVIKTPSLVESTPAGVTSSIDKGKLVKDLELGFKSISQQIDQLDRDYKQVLLSERNKEQLLGFYSRAKKLVTDLKLLLDSVSSNMEYKAWSVLLESIAPERWEKNVQLSTIIYETLDLLDESELTSEQLDDYVEFLGRLSHVYINPEKSTGSRRNGGYYIFGHSGFFFTEPEWHKLRNAVAKDRTIELTPHEEEIVQQAEDGIFKLHLQFSPEQWKLVLKVIMAALDEDSKIVQQIFADKEKNGDQKSAMPDEIKARGGKLTKFHHWKIQPLNPFSKYMPTIVCYTSGGSIEEKRNNLLEMTSDLIALLAEHNISLDSNSVPRYSAPVISQNHGEVPGFFYVAGDGDWKEYLKYHGKLDQEYDPDLNYAVRKGSEILFD